MFICTVRYLRNSLKNWNYERLTKNRGYLHITNSLDHTVLYSTLPYVVVTLPFKVAIRGEALASEVLDYLVAL